ncbi:class II fructose-bisphosphate aldolase [Patescibacteria group bacterium]|nr:class II fructose-bisphosphate aldolase [Patescibacteria group bacterium]MBU1034874.1 class II fructose-bisphosphate aldolase [Patescibacteria group bacterium]MBU1629519.1 class II fructose-bisphosphate aldolase [Patescibacteria group bacterium]MBU1907786.1 class II fructose-bisphosphate aldolase [Patescibacteria group bacterium]
MLISAKKILTAARAKRYAVPAFNVNNLEILKAVMSAAEKIRSPVIIQTSEGAIEYAGIEYLAAMIRVAAKGKIPVVMHLDHGKDLRYVKLALANGYNSIMIDGSALPYLKNVAITKKVVALAHPKGVSVEAEIGALAGIEDLISVKEKDAALTNPEEAVRFAKDTKCDSLAIAIGTSHGAYKFKGKTHLDIGRLKKIAKLVALPIVLHGASGVREDLKTMAEKYGAKLGEARGVMDQDIKAAIKNGVAKINIDTDLRLAFTAGMREALHDLPKVIDPRKLLEPSNILMREVAMRKMRLFGSAGKA